MNPNTSESIERHNAAVMASINYLVTEVARKVVSEVDLFSEVPMVNQKIDAMTAVALNKKFN